MKKIDLEESIYAKLANNVYANVFLRMSQSMNHCLHDQLRVNLTWYFDDVVGYQQIHIFQYEIRND